MENYNEKVVLELIQGKKEKNENCSKPSVLEDIVKRCYFAKTASDIALRAFMDYKKGDKKQGKLSLMAIREIRSIAKLENEFKTLADE